MWFDYTPVLTATSSNPTLGASSATEGRYCVIGTLVYVIARVQFGSSGAAAGSGTYEVSLPVPVNVSQYSASHTIGVVLLVDSGTTRTVGTARMQTGDAVNVLMQATGTNVSVSDAVPWTWANNDLIELSLTYEGVV